MENIQELQEKKEVVQNVGILDILTNVNEKKNFIETNPVIRTQIFTSPTKKQLPGSVSGSVSSVHEEKNYSVSWSQRTSSELYDRLASGYSNEHSIKPGVVKKKQIGFSVQSPDFRDFEKITNSKPNEINTKHNNVVESDNSNDNDVGQIISSASIISQVHE